VSSDPLAYLFSLEHFGIKFGLENITALLRALGDPQLTFSSVHVAGTNGKGSVTAMIDAVLRASGYRSARYTSPHLVNLRERFVIDGEPIDAAALAAVIDRIRDVVATLRRENLLDAHPTFFEVTTAAAFELFRAARVEVAVCEVGLGGRLDATNVLQPKLAVITSIALDHQQYLGNTLADIAREKAGIIKSGVPTVVGAVPPEAAEVIARLADDRGALLLWADEGTAVERVDRSATRVHARTRRQDYGEFDLPLLGAHQLRNAAVAIRAVDLLAESGMAIPPEAVRRGLSTVRWPGRLEHLMLSDGREALLDAAHNPAGAEALASYLKTEAEPRPLVFAVMRDKDVTGILRALVPVVSALVMTNTSNPRSTAPAVLAGIARQLSPNVAVRSVDRPEEALRLAWEESPRIVVAGSIFLLGDVLEALRPA
jgi:dihydrofolate synthase/folylpolyglutamate synthase